MIEPSVTYLQSKRSVDDRALSRPVLDALRAELDPGTSERPAAVLDLGSGSGTMLARCIEWDLVRCADYTALDTDAGALAEAQRELPRWAESHGLAAAPTSDGLALSGSGRRVVYRPVHADLFEFDRGTGAPWDVVIANAFLDLVDLPAALRHIWSLLRPSGLFWFTINFDGETIFSPECDPTFEAQLIELYHRSMDERAVAGRRTGGSRTGRRLFAELPDSGAELIAAGASDWVVHPVAGGYPHHEADFLRHLLAIIGAELSDHPQLDSDRLQRWLTTRRQQVEQAELTLISHQLDFVGRAPRGAEAP